MFYNGLIKNIKCSIMWGGFMESIYEKLFDTYGWSVLRDLERGYDEKKVFAQLDTLVQDKKVRLRLEDLFFDCYHRWSTDAFTLGLHLGLSLLQPVPRPQHPPGQR